MVPVLERVNIAAERCPSKAEAEALAAAGVQIPNKSKQTFAISGGGTLGYRFQQRFRWSLRKCKALKMMSRLADEPKPQNIGEDAVMSVIRCTKDPSGYTAYGPDKRRSVPRIKI